MLLAWPSESDAGLRESCPSNQEALSKLPAAGSKIPRSISLT